MPKTIERIDMKLSILDRKIENAMTEYRLDIQKQLKNYRRRKLDQDQWVINAIARLEKDLVSGTPFNLKLLKKSRVFKNGRDTCAIDLVNETGHSYRWWHMLKRVNGVLCLNMYRYSVCTSKHIRDAGQVLDKLKIKYLEIDAPQGLQDLDSASRYAASEYGLAVVQTRYQRQKNGYALNYARKRLANLKRIGVIVSQTSLKQAIGRGEVSRTERLKSQKLKRANRKEHLAKINNEIALTTTLGAQLTLVQSQ